ncbi:MAG: glycosyltransferase family 39 protein [Polyangiaceae bacterium]|nr:glycosyltransferase family 39 protein [Polyangiaceae bacterium]
MPHALPPPELPDDDGKPIGLRLRSVVLLVAACLPTLAVMSLKGHQALSLPLGLVSIALVSVLVLRLLGRLQPQALDAVIPSAVSTAQGPAERTPELSEKPAPLSVQGIALLLPLLHLVSACTVLLLALRGAVAGVFGGTIWLAGAIVTLTFLWCVFSLCLLAGRFRGTERQPRPLQLLGRKGLWLVTLNALLHLPLLGKFSLIDPWETHYGEVAREMLTRDDWISLWWAQDGWFWSKPILSFWMQGVSFAALGVGYAPDQMLVGAYGLAEPEWAARFPNFLAALASVCLLYVAIRRVWGSNVAFLGGLMITSMPYWYLLARQSVTDMAYVAPMVAGMALLLLGANTPDDAEAPTVSIKIRSFTLQLSLFTALVLVVVGLVLPQALYLISRNFTLDFGAAPILSFHRDVFSSGSGGGNCGLPGNALCQVIHPLFPVPEPAIAGFGWLGVLGYFLWTARHERREQRLLFWFAWVALALSTMAKGAPGLVIPLCTWIAFALLTGRWQLLRQADFPALGLLLACIALPWLVQMYARHGSGFTERLFLHDMYKRAFEHVHDTNAGTDTSFRYYLWQLGYGLFPWSGLAAVGLGAGVFADSEAPERQRHALAFLFLWLLCAYGVFSVTLTKFHHYILPAVPPIAILTAVTFAPIFTRNRNLSSADSLAQDPNAVMRYAPLSFAAACLLATIGRDFVFQFPGDVEPASRLIALFTYIYDRAWPANLDYSRTLQAFVAAFVLVSFLLCLARTRRAAFLTFCALSVIWAGFGVNVYLTQTAEHWGQRSTISAYYRARRSPSEPLVAFQMNWKGENFYTGNQLPAYVTTGKAFQTYLRHQRASGTQVMFFTTEHSRLKTLKSELGKVKAFTLITTPAENNKFFVARVEL